MNKKLIAIAVAAALAPIAAQAEPTVYGQGQVEYGTFGGKDTAGKDQKGAAMADNARGRIGIKNSEDLGNGMTALFKAEFKTDFADGDSGTADKSDKKAGTDATKGKEGIALQKREMMVGIKAGFGQIEVGRLKSPYKYTGGVKYDPYVTTFHEARGVVVSGKAGKGNGYGNNGFVSDSLSYQNKFGPLKVWVLRDMDSGGPAQDKEGNGLIYALAYQQGNIEAHFKGLTDDQEGTKEYTASAFGGKMKFGSMDVAIELESLEKGTGAGSKTDTMFINWNMKMGKNVITANYGVATTDTTVENETTKITLGVAHKFSKKTRAFVAHSIIEEGAAKKEERTVTSLGLRVDI